MNMSAPANSADIRLTPRIDVRRVFTITLAVALLALVIGLAVIGLDMLNETIARGFSALSPPPG